jgi:hypothetical protein
MFNGIKKWRVLLMAVLLWGGAGLSVSLAEPVAVAPEPGHTFPTVVEGTEVVHEFVIQNKGSDTLEIQKVKTG